MRRSDYTKGLIRMVPEPNVVVYTAIFNDYDVLLSPPESHADFVCYTDDPSIVPKGWIPREFDSQELSPKLSSGKIKTYPHEYLQEYEYSIWVDGHVGIRKDPVELIEFYLQEEDIAVPQHPFRQCVYEEAEYCVNWGMADAETVNRQMGRYREHGFPENFGLSETRVLLRRHSSPDVIQAMEEWWNQYQSGAQRDQLSFDYALWKTDVPYRHLPPDVTIDSEYFKRYPHKADVRWSSFYEKLLRHCWSSPSPPKYLLASFILRFYVGLYNVESAIRILRQDGPGMVFRMFKHHYL